MKELKALVAALETFQRVVPDWKEAREVTSAVALAAIPAVAETWITAIKGPPFAAKTPFTVPGGVATIAESQAVVPALQKTAGVLDRYASYRSSFPPPLQEGFDARTAEVRAAASAVADLWLEAFRQ